jgi:hypothetical protein
MSNLREPIVGEIVQVYRNLHREALSIRFKKTGLVIDYCSTVWLDNVRFHVSASGRARVLERKVRSVHAFCEGVFLSKNEEMPREKFLCSVYYQPYLTDYFKNEATGESVYHANKVFVSLKRAFIFEEGGLLF